MPKKRIGDPIVLPNFVSAGSRKARTAIASLQQIVEAVHGCSSRSFRVCRVGASAKQLRSVWAVLSNKDSALTYGSLIRQIGTPRALNKANTGFTQTKGQGI
jgi:hypothetical protein